MEPGTSEWTAVMNRLERLEKQNRRMKQIGALALVLIGSVLLMGQAPGRRTVEANEFILKDTNGKQRAVLTVDAYGPGLNLVDAAGRLRASLGVGADGPELHLLDANGKVRGSFSTLGQTTNLLLFDAEGKRRALLFLGGVLLYNSKTQAVASIITAEDGAILDVYGKGGANFAELGADGDGQSLSLSDKDGFRTTIGTTDLVTPRTGETHKTSAASIILFDKDKKVLWKAP